MTTQIWSANDKLVCQPVSSPSISLLSSLSLSPLLPSFLPFPPLSNLSASLFLLSLYQGNLRFSKGEQDELVIENGKELKVIAFLLASMPNMVEKALCYRVVGNKLGAVEKEHTLEQALYGRDAFAKVCVGGEGGVNGGGGRGEWERGVG